MSIPLEIDTLARDLREFQRWATVIEDSPLVERVLISIMRRFPTGGKQIHDANIVATMQVAKVRRLLTNNVADFRRYESQIEIISL